MGRGGEGEMGKVGEFWILDFEFCRALPFPKGIEIVGCISSRGLGIGGQPEAAMHRSGKEGCLRGGPGCPPLGGMGRQGILDFGLKS